MLCYSAKLKKDREQHLSVEYPNVTQGHLCTQLGKYL